MVFGSSPSLWQSPVLSAPIVEKIISSPWKDLGTLWHEVFINISKDLCLVFYSIQLYIFLSYVGTTLLITVALCYTLKSGSVNPLTVFFFQIVLAVQCPLSFHMNYSVKSLGSIVLILSLLNMELPLHLYFL